MSKEEDTRTIVQKAEKAMTENRYCRACILFEKIAMVERSGLICFDLGRAYLERKRYDLALKSLKLALDRRYDPATIHYTIGQVHFRMQNYKDALLEFKTSLEINSKQEITLLATGQACECLEEYDKAIDFYRRAVALQGGTINPLLYLARCHGKRNQIVEEVEVLKTSIKMEPENRDQYKELMKVLVNVAASDRSSIIENISALVVQLNSGEALLAWIETLMDSDASRLWGARLLIEKASDILRPSPPETRLRFLISRIEYHADLAPQLRTLLDSWSLPLLHAAWGCACLTAGKIDEALEQFEAVLQLDCLDERIWEIAGYFSQYLSHEESAGIQVKMEEIVESLCGPVVLVTWVATLFYAGKNDQALVFLRKASEVIKSPSLSSLLHRIWKDVLLAQNKTGEAIPHNMVILRLYPDQLDHWWTLSALLRIEPSDQWNQEITKLLDTISDPEILVEGAKILTLTGTSDLALIYFKKALQMNPGIHDAYDSLGDLLAKIDHKGKIIDRISAIVKQADSTAALYEWSRVLYRIGLMKEAIVFIEEARQHDPDDYRFPFLQSELCRKTDDYQQTFALHRLAAELGPEHNDIYKSWAESLVAQENQSGVTVKIASVLDKTKIPTADQIDWEDIRKARDTQLMEIDRFVSIVERWCDAPSTCDECGVKFINSLASYADNAVERLFKAGAVLDSKSIWLVYNIGVIQQKQLQYRKALEAFSKARELAQESRDLFLTRIAYANSLSLAQKYVEADQAYQDVFEAGIGLTSEEDIQAQVNYYNNWAFLLSNMNEFQRSLDISHSALQLLEDDYWSYFRIGYTYSEMLEYDRAIAAYNDAVRINPAHPYAMHNIAFILENQGLNCMAREQMKATLKAYQAGIAKAVRDRDENYFSNYGEVLAAMGNLDQAESLLRAAAILAPGSAHVQKVLLDIYLELVKESRNGREPTDANTPQRPKTRNGFYWQAQNAYQNARRLIEVRLADDRDPETLLELGTVELLKGEHEKALTVLNEAAAVNPSNARTFQKLGEAYLAQGRPRDAVLSLNKAISVQPDGLSIRTILGRAHLRSGNHDEAEREFVRVIDSAEFHVDAWIGLGEVYLEMAENKSAKDTARMDELYDRAIETLVRGIEIARSSDRPIMVTAEMDTAYYLLGYARVQLYESSRLRRDIRMLRKAQADFRKCLEVNPKYAKARRALQRIKEQKGMGRSLAEMIGPYLVIVLSFLMIGISLSGLLIGFVVNQNGYTVAPPSLEEALKDSGIESGVVDQLKRQVAEIRFVSEEKLIGAVQQVLGGEAPEKVITEIRKGIMLLPAKRQCFKVSEFATLFFGSLLFMVASVYLPQLTSLKLPGLQLDKSASERVEPIRLLGIPK